MAEGATVSIDGGGSSTDLLLLDRSSSKGVIVSGGRTNPNSSGMGCLEEFDRLMTSATEFLEISQEKVDEVIAGLAGRGNPKNRKAFQEKLETLFPKALVRQINDSELAHRGIWGSGAGYTILAGTGSVCIGTNGVGTVYFTGGLGHMVGDEGSGYWLVKTAITELIMNERSTDADLVQLREHLVKHFNAANFDELMTRLSNDTNATFLIASAVPVILGAAENGNFFADHIMSRGADHLTELVTELHEKMNDSKGDLLLGCTGSVIKNSVYYRQCMETALLYEFDSVEWLESPFIPVYGGLVLSSAGITLTDFEQIEIAHV